MIITNILLKVCVSVSQVHLDLCLWTIFPEFFLVCDFETKCDLNSWVQFFTFLAFTSSLDPHDMDGVYFPAH